MSATETINPRLDESWKRVLMPAFQSETMKELKAFLRAEHQAGHAVYPPGRQIFHALDATPFDAVRVVILGQDPYHGPGQANGLAFSVADGVRIPPSLQNVFKELHDDLGVPMPQGGNLEPWAGQGVLLLNATLTVRARQAGSHQGKGWEAFTDAVVQALNDHREGLVFLLWGRYAKDKGRLVDPKRHHILTAAHPSPYSADSGFFGCRHFSKTNRILEAAGQPPIDWRLP